MKTNWIYKLALVSQMTLLPLAASAMAKNLPEEVQQAEMTVTSVTPGVSVADMQSLFESMTRDLSEIEAKLTAGRNTDALVHAKQSLDSVRIKIGIDPKAKIQEPIPVKMKIAQPQNGFAGLSVNQQEQVIRTVKAYRGELFLDILNLAKRTTLLHIKALHEQLKAKGGLVPEDRDKILRDLGVISAIPLIIKDQTGNRILVFDFEMANEDQIYLFNREIKMYLLGAKDLAITNESFEKYKQTLVNNKRKEFGLSVPETGGFTEECVNWTLNMNKIGPTHSVHASASEIGRAQKFCRGPIQDPAIKACVTKNLDRMKIGIGHTVYASIAEIESAISLCQEK